MRQTGKDFNAKTQAEKICRLAKVLYYGVPSQP